MLIVRLAHVEHGIVASVDEDMHGLPLLVVDVDATRCHNHLDAWVLYAAAGVVATIADLQSLVLDVWLLVEELSVEEVLEVIDLIGLELERVGSPAAAPSSAHGEVALLRNDALALGIDVFEGDRAVPVHVPVVLSVVVRRSIAESSVRS